MVSDALGIRIAPVSRGEFRPGEMRSLTSDITKARALGYAPQVDLADGIGRYMAWIRTQGDIREYFTEAEAVLRQKRVVQRVGAD